jgi:FAD/FMN-containing dehydrogenase
MTSASTERYTVPGFTGALLQAEDAGYDDARKVFNGMIDRRPAVIARCRAADDVTAAIRFARAEGLPISVYGGGHAVTGAAVVDGGVCIDLRGMKGISVDPAARTVRAEGGVQWGEFDAATQAFGLGVTGGRHPDTGIAGLTLGSGSGWLERKFGYVCDNLIKAEMVTADGQQVIASATVNPDLFWAIRGGGGNFGVVTAFHLRLHPLGPIVMAGMLFYPGEMAAEMARFYRDFMENAPDELGGGMVFTKAPPMDPFPAAMRGQPAVGILVIYAGPVEEAATVLAPLRAHATPAVDLVQPMPYLAAQKLTEGGNPIGVRNYWTSDFYNEMPDAAIDALVEQSARRPSPIGSFVLVPGGGAPSRVADHETAFTQRQAPWNIHFLSQWFDAADDAANIAFTKAASGAMKPWATGRVYLNYIGDEGEERIEGSFGAETTARLRAIKAKWDPDNLFRHNQNIRPAAIAAE